MFLLISFFWLVVNAEQCPKYCQFCTPHNGCPQPSCKIVPHFVTTNAPGITNSSATMNLPVFNSHTSSNESSTAYSLVKFGILELDPSKLNALRLNLDSFTISEICVSLGASRLMKIFSILVVILVFLMSSSIGCFKIVAFFGERGWKRFGAASENDGSTSCLKLFRGGCVRLLFGRRTAQANTFHQNYHTGFPAAPGFSDIPLTSVVNISRQTSNCGHV